jgi:hypothetical protein
MGEILIHSRFRLCPYEDSSSEELGGPVSELTFQMMSSQCRVKAQPKGIGPLPTGNAHWGE